MSLAELPDLVMVGLAIFAAAACASAARTLAGRRRIAWALVALASLCWAGGVVIGRVSDAAYVTVGVCAAGGLMLLPAPRGGLQAARAAVDGLIVGGVLLWISWNVVGATLTSHLAGGLAASADELLEPLADVLIVASAGYTAAYSSKWARPILATLATGWSLVALSDSAILYFQTGDYQAARPIAEIGLVAGFALIGAAAVLATRRPWPKATPTARPLLATVLVNAIVVAGVVVSVLNPLHATPSPLLYWTSIVIVALLFVRQVLGIVDSRQLDRERGAALDELRDSEARMQQVLSHAPVVIFALDAEGTITLAKGSGVPDVENGVGYNLYQVARDHPLRKVIDPALAGSETQGEVMVRDRLLGVRCTPVLKDGVVTGVIGVAGDITDRRAAVQAKQESVAKDRFLANMSHELRTPLNSILGFAQMLSMEGERSLSDRQRRYQGHIMASGQQLLDLINELLDLAKVSAGQLEIRLSPTPIKPVVEEALRTIGPQAAAAGLTVQVGRMTGLEAVADPGRLRQILLNLLSNAVKFTPEGGRIAIRGHREGDWIAIDVRDTGVGISTADQDRIFQEFTQLDTGRNRAVQGTGLGLALSRALARGMGGDLTVASGVQKGSTFTVRLPAASAGGGELPDEVGQPAEPLAEVLVVAGKAHADGDPRD